MSFRRSVIEWRINVEGEIVQMGYVLSNSEGAFYAYNALFPTFFVKNAGMYVFSPL